MLVSFSTALLLCGGALRNDAVHLSVRLTVHFGATGTEEKVIENTILLEILHRAEAEPPTL